MFRIVLSSQIPMRRLAFRASCLLRVRSWKPSAPELLGFRSFGAPSPTQRNRQGSQLRHSGITRLRTGGRLVRSRHT
ncbi:unnamed protein product [Amoebophrya sp. A120]|nr:unnamed protein product [Amoebophrya sp. A120]|eukprot:GSA120T00013428001.1